MITPEEPLRLETVCVFRNGRRRYDPAGKQRLVEACLQPGVSLAGLALRHGVNANLLRKWVAKHQLQNGNVRGVAQTPIASAFIPVIAPPPAATRPEGEVAVRPMEPERSSLARLTASMPNGVRLTLEGHDAQLLSTMIEALGRCDVPAGV